MAGMGKIARSASKLDRMKGMGKKAAAGAAAGAMAKGVARKGEYGGRIGDLVGRALKSAPQGAKRVAGDPAGAARRLGEMGAKTLEMRVGKGMMNAPKITPSMMRMMRKMRGGK